MAAAPEDDDDELPRAFGSYLLLQQFARGGMGEVFLAKSGGIAGLERTCVLKKLRSELTRDREYVTRFIDEARVVVTLSHANICNVFDVGRVVRTTLQGDLEEYYLAMDYVSGRDLRTLLDRCKQAQRTTPTAVTLHLVCETLQALDYAHRRRHPSTGEPLNLVHRDVSPQNVLVSYEGEVKLIDFGLAASRLKVERTQPNVVMGKMAYMAPEQARGDPIDARADLFACGVVAYEMLSNERFYEGLSANDIWQRAGIGGFVPAGWTSLDPPLAAIIARAIDADPRRRFSSCGELREALLSYSHERWPGVGERSLRGLMEELFVDEIAREHANLARFGSVTVAAFRTELEASASHALTLVHSDPLPRPRSQDRHATTAASSDDATPRSTPRPSSEATPVDTAVPPLKGVGVDDARSRNPLRPAAPRDDKTLVTTRFPEAGNELTQLVERVQGPGQPSEGAHARRRRPETSPQVRGAINDEKTALVSARTTSIDAWGDRSLWVGVALVAAVVVAGGIGVGLGRLREGNTDPPLAMVAAPADAIQIGPSETKPKRVQVPPQSDAETKLLAALFAGVRHDKPAAEKRKAERPVPSSLPPGRAANALPSGRAVQGEVVVVDAGAEAIVDNKLLQAVMRSKGPCAVDLIKNRMQLGSDARTIQVHSRKILECAHVLGLR